MVSWPETSPQLPRVSTRSPSIAATCATKAPVTSGGIWPWATIRIRVTGLQVCLNLSPLSACLILITFFTFPGNGWAAAGMLRVFGTVKNSEYASDFKSEQNDLVDWVLEIQDGMYPYLVRSLMTPKLRHTSCHRLVIPDDHRPYSPSSDQPVVSVTTPTTTSRLMTLLLPHCSPPPSTVCLPWLENTITSLQPREHGSHSPPFPIWGTVRPMALLNRWCISTSTDGYHRSRTRCRLENQDQKVPKPRRSCS